jgi:hypothetical protein
METPHTETIVEKTVAFVKDVLGIHPEPGVGTQPEYHDTAPEVTVENAMRLDPDPHVMNAVGPMSTEAYVPANGRRRAFAARGRRASSREERIRTQR